MRKRLLILPLILLIAASGCAPAVPESSAAPDTARVSAAPGPPTPPPPDEPEITPDAPPEPVPPEPPTVDQAARLYAWFLDGKISGYVGDYECWITEEFSLGQGDPRGGFLVRDLTGDGVPELYGSLPGVHYIWSVAGGRVTAIETLVTYDTITANGGIFYHRPGGAPDHDDYSYKGFSPESRRIPDITFSVYHEDGSGKPLKVYLIDNEEVTEEEWNAVADIYFALRDAVPDRAHTPVVFSDWVAARRAVG